MGQSRRRVLQNSDFGGHWTKSETKCVSCLNSACIPKVSEIPLHEQPTIQNLHNTCKHFSSITHALHMRPVNNQENMINHRNYHTRNVYCWRWSFLLSICIKHSLSLPELSTITTDPALRNSSLYTLPAELEFDFSKHILLQIVQVSWATHLQNGPFCAQPTRVEQLCTK